jgi:hypothetical protein
LTTLINLQRFTQRTAKDRLSFEDSPILSEIFDISAAQFTYEKDSLLSYVKCEDIFEEETLKKRISSRLNCQIRNAPSTRSGSLSIDGLL